MGGSDFRVGLTSSHHFDTGGVEVKIMSEEILLEAREELRRRN